MKGFLRFIIVTLTFLTGYANAANYQSAQTGNWTTPGTWTTTAPDYDDLKNDNIFIGTTTVAHEVTLGSKESPITVGEGNGVEITIRKGSKLIIYGDISVKNNFKIIVEEGAEFLLYGGVIMGGGGGTGSDGQLIINGKASITGDVTGNGSVTGNGELYVGGTLGVGTGGFTGTIVNGNTDLSLASPFLLEGWASNNGINISVGLNWQFPEGEANFSHFQVFRNSALIANNVTEKTFSEELAMSIYGSQMVAYYVRAVYNIGGVITYSSISNIENFNGSPLPIELLYFKATASAGAIEFSWATAAEINNDFFTIEKSTNARDWSTLAITPGAGNSNSVLQYIYTVAAEGQGIAYYRLKQTDYDGKFEYFAPLAVNPQADASNFGIVRVNNHGNAVNILVQNPSQAARMIASDMQGRILGTFSLQPEDGIQTLSLDIPHTSRMLFIRLVAEGMSDEKKVMVR